MVGLMVALAIPILAAAGSLAAAISKDGSPFSRDFWRAGE